MRERSSTTRIVCRSVLLQTVVRLPVPFLKIGRHPVTAGVVAVTPSPAPEEAARDDRPDQHKKQNRESETPRAIPAVRVRIRRQLRPLSHHLLRQAMRHADVVCHDRGNRRQEQDPQKSRACEIEGCPFISYLLQNGVSAIFSSLAECGGNMNTAEAPRPRCSRQRKTEENSDVQLDMPISKYHP